VTALECAPARRVHKTDSRFSSMSTAAVVEAFEISEEEAEAATLELLCGGCGELGRGASIAALATSGERPRLRGRGRRAPAENCCFFSGFWIFFRRRRAERVAR